MYVNTQARRVVFEGKKAVGIVTTTSDDDRPFTLNARKEILIAAGAYHSPQLLMVSGVGHKDVLKPLGIPLVSHLPGVGQNMRDSCYLAGPVYEVTMPGPSYWREPGRMVDATDQFLSNASGPLTNIGVDFAVWDILSEERRSNISQTSRNVLNEFPEDWPLIEYSLSSTNRVSHSIDPERHYGTIDCVLVATSSRGNMTISSSSNRDPPIINPNWLRDEVDQEVAIQAYRRARKAWRAVPDGVRVGKEVFPGENVTTDTELLDAIKTVLSPIHHVSSSCELKLSVPQFQPTNIYTLIGAMGKASSSGAVVDTEGRVYGAQGLRVIDSSAFPFTPPGHTQAMTYALAEKLVEGVISDMTEEDPETKDGVEDVESNLGAWAIRSDL